MRIGIFGGTFNPPHLGHIRAFAAFAEYARPDRLFVIPAYIPPLKAEACAPAADRLEMCRLAFPFATVSDSEIASGGVSYTWKTVSRFAGLYPGAEIYLLIGTDQLAQLEKWRNTDYLFKKCVFAVASRFADGGITDAEIARHRALGASVIRIPLSETVVSSSEIRDGGSAEMLTPAVYGYIREHGLYGKIRKNQA